MNASINGVLMPASEAKVSIFDRSFCYGDGLFETVRIHKGQPLLWAAHLHRFGRAAEEMALQLPPMPKGLIETVVELVAANHVLEGVLRIHLSRGVGPRGFSMHEAYQPLLVMTAAKLASEGLSAAPRRVMIAETVRVPAGDRFSWFKSANRLHYVVARSEAEAEGYDDSIVLNVGGEVADFSSASLMLLRDGVLIQPPLSSGRLEGVMSAWLVEHSGLACREEAISREALRGADAILYLSSVAGVAWVSELGSRAFQSFPLVERLRGLWDAWVAENLFLR